MTLDETLERIKSLMTLDETLERIQVDESTEALLMEVFDRLTESKKVRNATWSALDNFIPQRSPVRKNYQKHREICSDLKVIMAMVYLAGRTEGQLLALEQVISRV